ncbi:MAG: hypothetical protein JNN27_24395 [Planctomycetes bacterium]|nr:hypothetical protein [Planctomycetota bacterium]
MTTPRASAYSADMRSMVVILASVWLGAGCARSTLQVRALPAAAPLPLAALEPTNEPSPAPAPLPSFPLAVASPLDCAIEAARTSGKPVLVIVTGPEVRAQRGRWLADWMDLGARLDLGEQRFTAFLSLAEIAFATPEQLREALPAKLERPASFCAVGLLDVLGPEPTLHHLRSTGERTSRGASTAVAEYGGSQDSLRSNILFHLTRKIAGQSAPRRRRIAYEAFSRDERLAMKRALKKSSIPGYDLALRGAWWCFDECSSRSPVWQELAIAQQAAFDKRAPFGARWAQFDGLAWSVQFEPQDDKRDCELLLQRAAELNPLRLFADWSDYRVSCGGVAGPCGTGHTGEVSYSFLDQYTRVLVDATDLD